jgi:hypothetical protein
LPVDATGGPTGVGAFYLTDNTSVYAVTVSATGMMRFWRTVTSRHSFMGAAMTTTPNVGARVTGRMKSAASDAGSMLVETMVAMCILLIAMAGLLAMDGIATNFTENYGHLASRTAEYAQDKMEQLLVLAYGDVDGDTRVFPPRRPAAPASRWAAAAIRRRRREVRRLPRRQRQPAAVGRHHRAHRLVFQAGVGRAQPSTNLKRITVTVTVAIAFGRLKPPQSTMVALKSFPF